MNNARICGCCDESVVKLVKKLNHLTNLEIPDYVRIDINQKSPETPAKTIDGLIDIIINPLDQLSTEGHELIKQCVSFLTLQKNNPDSLSFQKTNQNQFHKTKYITIWSFIYDYLKIKQNSGYDYFLLSYLEHYYIMEHGSGIRCGWLTLKEDDHYYQTEVSKEFKEKINIWGKNAPDEL